MLDLAAGALVARNGFAAYPAHPGDYPDWAEPAGRSAFETCCGSQFHLDQHSGSERVGDEVSPYRGRLGIRYPGVNIDQMLAAAVHAGSAWSREDAATRVGVCLEALDRLHARIFELAYAVMHTTGAPFWLAFRVGGAEALGRAIEAVALAHQEMMVVPREIDLAVGGGHTDARAGRRVRALGRGVALVIGCSHQPTWAGFPALFASIATGNAVIVKPHPQAVLPLAIAVAVVREVLRDVGAAPDLVALAADDTVRPLAQILAARPEVRIIDYTGGIGFAEWLSRSATHARQYRFAAATNAVIVDSTADPGGMVDQLAHSVTLFAGRLCTSPRVLFVSRTGIGVPDGTLTSEEFCIALARRIQRLIDESPTETLGAMRVGEFDAIVDAAASSADAVVDSRRVDLPDYPGASIRTPLLIRVRGTQWEMFARERFGPVVAIVECDDVAESLSRAAAIAREEGMLAAQVHSVDAGICSTAADALLPLGVVVELNSCMAERLSPVPVAFSDLHGAGMNPAANTTLGSGDYVAGRFHFATIRG